LAFADDVESISMSALSDNVIAFLIDCLKNEESINFQNYFTLQRAISWVIGLKDKKLKVAN